MSDENQEPLHLGASLPASRETQPTAEPGASQAPGETEAERDFWGGDEPPYQITKSIKGDIECVRPLKDASGRLFLFRDGSRAELYDDGTIVLDPWDSESEPAKLEAIARWKRLRGWQPIQPKP